MVGRPKFKTKKWHLAQAEHNDLMDHTVIAYHIELTKPAGVHHRSAHTICSDFEALYKQETEKPIHLSYSTLQRLTNGGKTKAQSNADHRWLTPEEVEIVIEYIVEVGERGFPLSHKRLKEHVDEICCAKLGSKFPEAGVGKNWTDQFVEKHLEQIKTFWAHSLESKWGWAMNPHMKEAYHTILNELVQKHDITPKRTFAIDEIRMQGSLGQPESVIGARKMGPQYQQRDRDWENITVLITICTDRGSTPPAVIFKGNAYQVKWQQDNPVNAL
jgi:Tc5 transposase DNA-binding domain